jgi:hypothetical protein
LLRNVDWYLVIELSGNNILPELSINKHCPLKVGQIGCLDRSVAKNQSKQRNATEELRHPQAYFVYLKLRILLFEFTAVLWVPLNMLFVIFGSNQNNGYREI